MEAFREMIKGRLGKFMLALLMLPFALFWRRRRQPGGYGQW